jgi:hypothetical protein
MVVHVSLSNLPVHRLSHRDVYNRYRVDAMSGNHPSAEALSFVREMLGDFVDGNLQAGNIATWGRVWDAFAARKVVEAVAQERERCAKIGDQFALLAADSAQVGIENSTHEAKTSLAEDLPHIQREFWRRQNYMHGKRHCAVEIARQIRNPDMV